MSETFVIASRLRLKKKAVTAWLRDTTTPVTAVQGWADLFAELDPGRGPLTTSIPIAKSVRHVFAEVADEVAASELGGLVAAWNGPARSFLFYQVMIGWQPATVAATLSALASAARHWTPKLPTTALVFAETSGRLSADGALATLSIGKDQAFVAHGVDVSGLVADLAPAEASWLRALDVGLVDAMHEPDLLQPGIRQLAKSPLLAKRKLQVPSFDSAGPWLAAIGSVKLEHGATPTVTRYASFGRFERDIMTWANQVAEFGPECHEELLRLVEVGPWERALIAFWACNVLARSTGDGRFYLTAIDRWRSAPHSSDGWGRGELTDDHIQASRDHKAALVGTSKTGWTFLRLLRSS